MAIYNTPAEARDIETLEKMGFEVINPNSETIDELFNVYRDTHPDNYMEFFTDLAAAYDITAFRALPCGRIPSGVALEVAAALKAGKIVIELPCGMISRSMNHGETVEYLENIGQR
jgi:hypothetical protein